MNVVPGYIKANFQLWVDLFRGALTNPSRTTLIGQKIEDQIKYHH